MCQCIYKKDDRTDEKLQTGKGIEYFLKGDERFIHIFVRTSSTD